MAVWTPEPTPSVRWLDGRLAAVLRVTEDARVRVIEDGTTPRFIEYSDPPIWTEEIRPPAAWAIT